MEGLSPGMYEHAKEYFGGDFDTEYNKLAESDGDEAARKFLLETLRATMDEPTYKKITQALYVRNQEAAAGVAKVQGQAARFQQESGPELPKKTF